jgi:hypothetical protein
MYNKKKLTKKPLSQSCQNIIRKLSKVKNKCVCIPTFSDNTFSEKEEHSFQYFHYLIKNGLGYILGDFFTNSSGHPGSGGN